MKYIGEKHANHLLSVLREFYVVDKNEKGSKYCGITLDWDYQKRKVHLSMPGYSNEALQRFRHDSAKRNDQPHEHSVPAYGARVQYAKKLDESPVIGPADKLFIQQVTGTFLYYARAVDSTMLVALSTIASQQANPTEETMRKTLQFLDYVATHPDAILTYSASNMVLNVHSDASYLIEPKARSRAGGHFYMSSNSTHSEDNGAVLNIAKIMKHVMTSAAEAEIGALFLNSRQAIPASRLLEEMGHRQPPTPVQTDNTPAFGFVNKIMVHKATKFTNMNHWWMRN